MNSSYHRQPFLGMGSTTGRARRSAEQRREQLQALACSGLSAWLVYLGVSPDLGDLDLRLTQEDVDADLGFGREE